MEKQEKPETLPSEEQSHTPVIHSFEKSPPLKKGSQANIMVIGGILLAGIVSGYLLFRFQQSPLSSAGMDGTQPDAGMVVGMDDTRTFSDSAEGELEEGGINGEGTHKLLRPGGDNQTVYLTSSVLDLSQFVGKRVRVWGETFAAQEAGWLMDVGKVEVLQ